METSPEKWREASIRGIKLAHTIIENSGLVVDSGKVTDPLPLLRDACIKHSNDRIRAYMRATRAVVTRLRRSFVEVNDEMKSANRCKESLEKALEHKKKDMILNQESHDIRSSRPTREKEQDGADKLLLAEQSHLISLKRSLEVQLRKVKMQLQELSTSRNRLAAAIQERSRVTDLLCNSISSDNYHSSQARTQTPRDITRSASNVSLQRTAPNSARESPHYKDKEESRPMTISRPGSRLKAYSAPVPLELGTDKHVEIHSGSVIDLEPTSAPGPYNALSCEASQAISMASEAISKSRLIRQEAVSVIDHTHRMQQASHDAVNETLIRKIAQTVTLNDHLELSSGDTRVAFQRCNRQHCIQQKALGYLLGPESLADISARERLDRPMVRVFQRHVGTDMPDAAHLIQATEQCRDVIDTTARNMALLKLAAKGLKADVKDKKKAAILDSSVVRLRRRKANHRWVLQGKAFPAKPPVETQI